MALGKRRRRNALLLGLMAVLVGVVASAAGWFGDSERVASFWVEAVLDDTAEARVTEVIEYDFGVHDRHGIYREIPDLRLELPIDVSSSGAPDQFTTRGDDLTRVQIGDPNQLISGRHSYRISYSLTSLDDGGRIAWDAIGTSWRVGMDEVEIHLRAPFELVDPECRLGRFGSKESCQVDTLAPGHLVVTGVSLKDTRSDGSTLGITVFAGRGNPVSLAAAPPVPELAPDDPGTPWWQIGLVGLVSGGLFMPLVSRLLRWWGRERVRDQMGTLSLADSQDLIEDGVSLSVTPPDYEPWVAGVIHAEQVLDQHQTAWLVQKAVEGQVDMVGDKSVVLTVGPNGLSDPTLITMFAGRHEIVLGRRDPAFRTGWLQVQSRASQVAKDTFLWEKRADLTRMAVTLGGAVFALLGLAAGVWASMGASRLGSSSLFLVAGGLAVAGVGLTCLVRAWELRVRTPEGTAAWLSIESFRQYLAVAEAEQADWAASQGLVTEYAAWAVALGETDQWTKAVEKSASYRDARSSTRDFSRRRPLTNYAMIPLLGRLERNTVATVASESSSSSGGSGSVGGGGGGGSW